MTSSKSQFENLEAVHAKLRACRKCNSVCGEAVHGPALKTKIMILGQAPGIHEASLGRPFAYTAGKTLFKWLAESTGATEADIRESVYFSAVARCFPGKAASGAGDRPPSAKEIENCREHLEAEIALIRPSLIIAVGRSALVEVLRNEGFSKTTPLAEVVGKKFATRFHGHPVEVIALPHPSGVSRWPQTEPGKTKLREALELLRLEFIKHC